MVNLGQLMRRDPKLLKALREATPKAAEDLQTLKLSQAESSNRVTDLQRDLRSLLIKTSARFVSDARSIVAQAKESSARHRRELLEIRKIARQAATRVRVRKKQQEV